VDSKTQSQVTQKSAATYDPPDDPPDGLNVNPTTLSQVTKKSATTFDPSDDGFDNPNVDPSTQSRVTHKSESYTPQSGKGSLLYSNLQSFGGVARWF
jgi:hypothetical protein